MKSLLARHFALSCCLFLTTSSLLSSGCGESDEGAKDDAACPSSGKDVRVDGQTYCVYSVPITEEGFVCPADYAMGARFGDTTVVCSKGDRTTVTPEVLKAVEAVVTKNVLPTESCSTVLCDVNQVCGNGTCGSTQEATCVANCGVGCPALEFQVCAADGNKYCNECVMGCKGTTKASDPKSCDQAATCGADTCTEIEPISTCISACGVTGIQNPRKICGSNGKFYDENSACATECLGITEVADQTTCSGDQDDPFATCVRECGIAPDCDPSDGSMLLCGTDGKAYCSECAATCASVTKDATKTYCMEP